MGVSKKEMRSRFQDKVIIVTGASTGIGRETALAFAREGARVTLAARNEAKLRELAESDLALRERFLAVPADVTQDADVQRLVDMTVAKWGRVDILVNNAGFGIRATVEQTQFADAERLMDLNFFGVLRCTQAVLPQMKRQTPDPDGVRGQIVNIGSILSVLATPRNGVYSASKFAVRALSDALRIELRGSGIEVILIMPGYTNTPFFENQVRYGGPVRIGPLKGVRPGTAARAILHACARHKREVALTIPGKFGVWMKRWFPRLLDWTLGRGW
jgi:short-subunit dehydrogenase